MARRDLQGDPQRRYALPEEWPEADRQLWASVLRPGASPLDEAGGGADWSPHGHGLRREAYGHWITWLRNTRPQLLAEHPLDRISPETVRDYVAATAELVSSCTLTMRLTLMVGLVLAADPHRDWRFLKQALAVLRRRAEPVTEKRGRIIHARRLLELGLALMNAAREASPDGAPAPWREAVRYRDGLMIALLAARPLRRRSLLGLVIGESLVRSGQGYDIAIPASGSKSHRRIEFPLPDLLVPRMRLYLDRFRPRLINEHNDRGDLWIGGHRGRPLSFAGAYGAIIRHTSEAFGRSVNPHLFRDSVATSVAIDDPKHIGGVVALLGHSTLATATKYYNQASMITASRAHRREVAAQRRALDRSASDDDLHRQRQRRRRPRQLTLALPEGG